MLLIVKYWSSIFKKCTLDMERFHRIVPLLRRNDPIINSLNMTTIKLEPKMTEDLVSALSQNTFISKIVLQDNKLSCEDCKKVFGLLLSNPKLAHLEVVSNNVDDEAVQFLSEVLQKLRKNHEPITIVLRSNKLTQKGAEALAEALRRNVPVSWLDLRYNARLTDEGVEKIASALSSNQTLTGLDLIKCGCDRRGAAALAEALTLDNHTLTTLLLQDTLSWDAIDSIGRMLADVACRLEALYLWHCELEAKHVQILCSSLKDNKALKTLALSYNELDDHGGVHLSHMLVRNRGLTKLHLGANHFSEMTAGYLGVALAKNNALQFLDLSRNYLKSGGVWPLAVSLMHNKALKTIDLRHNNITESATDTLCELIRENTSIQTMRLSGNPFNDRAIVHLARQLEMNTTLKDLELNDVRMTGHGFKALCRALMKNKTMEKISLNKNPIRSHALKWFARLLKENTSLQTVGLSECEIGREGCVYIAEGIQSNGTLNELDLKSNEIDIPGILVILDAIIGNYSLMKIDWVENPFTNEPHADEVSGRIIDFLERNNYYHHNILMRDMRAVAEDVALM